jgi:glycosyltransferase involved in cell wall biosynthesis
MRIVIAHESLDTDGGVETYLVSVIRELSRRGHAIALVHDAPRRSGRPLATSVDDRFCVSELGLDGAIARVRAWTPDVCFSHNIGPLAIDRALAGAWPVVKMLHGFFGTCVSGLKMHAFPSPVACRRTCGPACLVLYVPRRCGRLSLGAMWSGYRWAEEQRRLFSRYRGIVVASSFMRDEVLRHGATRVDAVPLFSTVAPVANVREAEPDTVLFAGRMTSLKGGDVLVAAAARASRVLGRSVRVIFAGDGPQRDAWQRLSQSLGVDAEFVGWVDEASRPQVFSRAAIAVVPSLWPEPFGLVGLDAAALGRPAVAFDVGGIGEWLEERRNGRLVEPGAGEAGLAAAIVSLLSSPAERGRMAEEALAVARRLTVAAHVDRLEPLLHGRVA